MQGLSAATTSDGNGPLRPYAGLTTEEHGDIPAECVVTGRAFPKRRIPKVQDWQSDEYACGPFVSKWWVGQVSQW